MLIATHNGPFHADDVLGVAMLRVLHPDARIERTRDEATLRAADFVVDVGGVHDPVTGRFDHHQKGRAGERPSGILYSAAGLIWARHGGDIVARVLGAYGIASEVVAATQDEVAARVDAALVAPVCATDNGQETYTPVQGVRPYTLSSVLGAFNPSWVSQPDAGAFESAFHVARAIAGEILQREIVGVFGLVHARSLVAEAVTVSPEDVLILPRFVPWQEHLGTTTSHQYVVFPNPEGTWMCQAVPAEKASFKSKRLLPEAWAGLREQELARVTGVADVVFCHPGRFICGAKTREGALALARVSLAEGGAS